MKLMSSAIAFRFQQYSMTAIAGLKLNAIAHRVVGESAIAEFAFTELDVRSRILCSKGGFRATSDRMIRFRYAIAASSPNHGIVN
jgi:hypothetical protein